MSKFFSPQNVQKGVQNIFGVFQPGIFSMNGIIVQVVMRAIAPIGNCS